MLAKSSGTDLGEIERLDYGFVEVRTRRSFSYDRSMVLESAAPDIEPEAMEAEEGVTIVWSIS